jgi:hypothetical protein
LLGSERAVNAVQKPPLFLVASENEMASIRLNLMLVASLLENPEPVTERQRDLCLEAVRDILRRITV